MTDPASSGFKCRRSEERINKAEARRRSDSGGEDDDEGEELVEIGLMAKPAATKTPLLEPTGDGKVG